jgi:hypothetical protein
LAKSGFLKNLGMRQRSSSTMEAAEPLRMAAQSRRDLVYIALAGFFVSNAILGEVTGGKLFTIGPFTMSIGVIP